MTSSANIPSSQSDECGTDEQRKRSQLNIQPHPSMENLPFGIAPQSTQFMMPHGYPDMGQNAVQAAYPFVDPYYRSILAAYHEGQPLIHPYYAGAQPGLPLPSDAVEEPVYVNAKQYRGILRRRQSRAKAQSENKLIISKKPYLHESRHLHALKRARGCGGRFLTAKDDEKNNGDSLHDKAPSSNNHPEKQQNAGSTHHQTYCSTSSSSKSACLGIGTDGVSTYDEEHDRQRSGNSSSSS